MTDIPEENWMGGLSQCQFEDGCIVTDVGTYTLPPDVAKAVAAGLDMTGYETVARRAVWRMWNTGAETPDLPTWETWSKAA